MSTKELTKLEVIQRVCHKRLTQKEAGAVLGLSIRQVKRLSRTYKADGARALVSKRRGQPSNNRLPEATIGQARDLLHHHYYDFGPTLAHEKLWEMHGLRLSVESVRQLMIAEGLWRARHTRPAAVHQLRERRAACGELIQIDGSPHDWFEGRAPKCTLLVMIDDATGRLMHLQMERAETTFAYFAAVRAYITAHGKPLAFYSDKYGVFRVNIAEARSGTGLTQFGRAMKELGIDLICAHSPQAKGRVERANQTLQDRLVKELRLRGLSDMTEANAYLPEFIAEFNSRFAVAARSAVDAHRSLSADEDLDRILTLVEERKLSKNLTISYNNAVYQLQTKRAAYTMRGASVDVREAADGQLSIEYKGKPLVFTLCQEPPRQPSREVPAKLLGAALDQGCRNRRRHYAPVPLEHPWRKFDYSENSLQAKRRRGESGDTSTWEK